MLKYDFIWKYRRVAGFQRDATRFNHPLRINKKCEQKKRTRLIGEQFASPIKNFDCGTKTKY